MKDLVAKKESNAEVKESQRRDKASIGSHDDIANNYWTTILSKMYGFYNLQLV